MINIEDFDPNLLKIDKKLCKNIGIRNIGYIATKKIDDYGNIYNVNSTDGDREVLKKYAELWNGIKNEIETINAGKKLSMPKIL